MSEHIIKSTTEIDFDKLPLGSIHHLWLKIVSDGLGNPISVPVIIVKGAKPGPVLGLTAAVHGNELNGISVIHRLINEVNVEELTGVIVGVPVVNVPSFVRRQRRFIDGKDINHIMPGNPNGNVSQLYAYRFMDRLVSKFDYLLDLHTASQGRINSYYVRADLDQPITKELALLQNADIIVHNPPLDGTLRGAADALDIPAITLEVGNPNTFQKHMIRSGVVGVHNVLCYLQMIKEQIVKPESPTIICESSAWMYTDRGGLLTVSPKLLQRVKSQEVIASMKDIFGNKIKDYRANADGIIIGKSISPVNQSGGRILHLGFLKISL